MLRILHLVLIIFITSFFSFCSLQKSLRIDSPHTVVAPHIVVVRDTEVVASQPLFFSFGCSYFIIALQMSYIWILSLDSIPDGSKCWRAFGPGIRSLTVFPILASAISNTLILLACWQYFNLPKDGLELGKLEIRMQ